MVQKNSLLAFYNFDKLNIREMYIIGGKLRVKRNLKQKHTQATFKPETQNKLWKTKNIYI